MGIHSFAKCFYLFTPIGTHERRKESVLTVETGKEREGKVEGGVMRREEGAAIVKIIP